MNVLICSKYKYHERWAAIKAVIEHNGHVCTTPLDIDMGLHGKADEAMTGDEYIASVAKFHEYISSSDTLYVLNFDGEFGKSMMLEIGYAAALQKQIICLEHYDKEPSLKLFIKEVKKPEEV